MNTNSILQSPLDEVISAYPPKPKKIEREERKVEKKKEKEQKQQAKKALKKNSSLTDISKKFLEKPEQDQFQQQEDVYSKTISPMGTGFQSKFKPILDLYISATSYPIQVSSLQAAKEWDDAFFPDVLESMDATSLGQFSSSES